MEKNESGKMCLEWHILSQGVFLKQSERKKIPTQPHDNFTQKTCFPSIFYILSSHSNLLRWWNGRCATFAKQWEPYSRMRASVKRCDTWEGYTTKTSWNRYICPGGEMVDTTVLEAVALRCESSSLSPGTKENQTTHVKTWVFVFNTTYICFFIL